MENTIRRGGNHRLPIVCCVRADGPLTAPTPFVEEPVKDVETLVSHALPDQHHPILRRRETRNLIRSGMVRQALHRGPLSLRLPHPPVEIPVAVDLRRPDDPNPRTRVDSDGRLVVVSALGCHLFRSRPLRCTAHNRAREDQTIVIGLRVRNPHDPRRVAVRRNRRMIIFAQSGREFRYLPERALDPGVWPQPGTSIGRHLRLHPLSGQKRHSQCGKCWDGLRHSNSLLCSVL